MKERPSRRLVIGERRGRVFGDAGAGKCISGGTCGSVKTGAQPIDDDDRHQLGYLSPLLPAMKAPQVIRAHDPDESHSRAAGQQPSYRIVGISRLNDSFEARHVDPRMMSDRPRGGDSLRQGRKPAGILQRIAGSYEPPHAIKLQPLERKQGRPEMRLVRRIECPPKKTNSHAGRVQGQQALRNSGFFGCHGRV